MPVLVPPPGPINPLAPKEPKTFYFRTWNKTEAFILAYHAKHEDLTADEILLLTKNLIPVGENVDKERCISTFPHSCLSVWKEKNKFIIAIIK